MTQIEDMNEEEFMKRLTEAEEQYLAILDGLDDEKEYWEKVVDDARDRWDNERQQEKEALMLAEEEAARKEEDDRIAEEK
jgi:flagellar biosynthesis chaperone FliJ